MRKITSSAFILLLLLLSLWGLSTWFFATQNKPNIEQIFNEFQSDSFPYFEYQNEGVKHSIFNSHSQFILRNSSENAFSDLWSSLNNKLILEADVNNGPLLFDKSGIDIGTSAWKISFDKDSNGNNDELLKTLKLKKSPVAHIKNGFDNKIRYELPISSLIGNFNIIGTYDPVTNKGSGEIQINNLLYRDIMISLKANQAVFKYSHYNDREESLELTLATDIPELLLQLKSMPKHVNLQLLGINKLSINNQTLDLTSDIKVEQRTKSIYPIDKSNFKFMTTDLKLTKLFDLSKMIGKLENLNAQTQWILEEQGELPEGQDQIWQRQDDIEQISSKMPSYIKALLMRDEKPVSNFSLTAQHGNKQSSLTGSLIPNTDIKAETTFSEPTALFLSFIQANANVKLDKTLFDFIATQSPIRKNQFKLIFKDNRLLMH